MTAGSAGATWVARASPGSFVRVSGRAREDQLEWKESRSALTHRADACAGTREVDLDACAGAQAHAVDIGVWALRSRLRTGRSC